MHLVRDFRTVVGTLTVFGALAAACTGDEFSAAPEAIPDASAGGASGEAGAAGGAVGGSSGNGGGAAGASEGGAAGTSPGGQAGGGAAGSAVGGQAGGGAAGSAVGGQAGATQGGAAGTTDGGPGGGDSGADAPPDAVTGDGAGADAAGCPQGTADCDGDASNGCEVNTASSVSHCGACNQACPTPASGTLSCVAGQCVLTCPTAGWKDCDGVMENGCETNISGTPQHCGACNNACAAPDHATATCVNFQCGSVCWPEYGDCDNLPGCETDLSSAQNCGYCGHACAPQTVCSNRYCPAETLATSTAGKPGAIALDQASVYWTTLEADAPIRKVGKTGTPSAADLLATPQHNARGITVAGNGAIYWAAAIAPLDGVIRTALADGSAYTNFATGLTEPLAVTSDGSYVYWTTGAQSAATGTVQMKSLVGDPAPMTLAANQLWPHAIAVEQGAVFWATAAQLMKWSNGVPATLASAETPAQLTVGAGHVFFTNNQTVRKVPTGGGAVTNVYHPSPTGGAGIATDGARLFWAQGNSIWTVAVGGGVPVRVATNLTSPSMVVLDSAYVYWCEQAASGRIMRVTK